MLKDSAYKLLLPIVRQELLKNAIKNIIERQSKEFTESAKLYYQWKHWVLTEEEVRGFILNPEKLMAQVQASWDSDKRSKRLSYDWLEEKRRNSLFQDVSKWASKEREHERAKITKLISKKLEHHNYGLSLHLQKEIESDVSFYLDIFERRTIIVEMEKPLRQKAEQEFTGLIQNTLIFKTLVPEVEEELLSTGKNKFLLVEEKNTVSFQVRTAVNIISSLRQPFGEVIASQVQSIATSRRIDENLVQDLNLAHRAYISRQDVDKFVEKYKPADQKQVATVQRSFEMCAKNEQLHIVPQNGLDEFVPVMETAVVRHSEKYRLSLKDWLTSEFAQNLVRIGAAYGVAEDIVNAEIDAIKKAYPQWVFPNWNRLVTVFLSITGGLVFLRWLITVTGYGDWVFVSVPVHLYDKNPYMSMIDFSRAFEITKSGGWVLGPIVGGVIWLLSRKGKG